MSAFPYVESNRTTGPWKSESQHFLISGTKHVKTKVSDVGMIHERRQLMINSLSLIDMQMAHCGTNVVSFWFNSGEGANTISSLLRLEPKSGFF